MSKKIIGVTVGTPIKPTVLKDKLNAITSSASGEGIVLSDSADAKLKSLKLYGKTTQNGTPSPEAPVELMSAGDDGTIDVSVYGKNLFNEAIMLNADGWKYENGFYTGDNIKLRTFFKNNPLNIFRPNTRYYFSFWGYSAEASKNSRICIGYTDGTFFDITGARNTDLTFCEYVTDERKSVSHIMIDYGDYATIYLRDFMICESQSATDYEPYKASQTLTVSTPNGLAGIPVASDGNYIDSNGQQWVCDEVDFARGVYVQRVKEIVLDGSDDEDWNDGVTGNAPYGISVNRYSSAIADCTNTDTRIMCDRYPTATINESWEAREYLVSRPGATNERLCFRNTAISSLAEWKADIATNPITVCYVLATPIETHLSYEQLLAYVALHTNYPNTTILNDDGAGMDVAYVADLKNYIDNRIASLSAAIVNS